MDIQRLITQLIYRAHAVDYIVRKLRELTYPSESPMRLAGSLSELAKAIRAETVERYQAGVASPEDFAVQLKFAIHVLAEISSDLRFVERARTRQTPWSLVLPMERLAAKLHTGTCFVIRPQWSYNYSIIGLTLRYRRACQRLVPVHVLDAILPPPAPGENGGFYVLGLPYIERLSVLQHTILGHELGHPIEKEYFSQEDPQSYMSGLRQAVINEIGLPSPQGTLQTGTEATAMLERIVNIRHRALAELTCDLVAVNLFAFAGLLATDEFAVTQALDRPPGNWQTHYPPWRYRLRVMMGEFPENWFDQFLESGGFPEHIADIVREKVVVLRALIGKDDDKKVLEANAEFRIAYEAVEVTLPKIRNFVRDRLGGCGLTINDIIGHANGALLTRLNDWIPPDAFLNRDGHDTVADLRAILNVGWVRKLDGYTAIQGNVNDPELLRTYFRDTNAINRLVLKGIEYADIREMWAKIPKKDE